MPEKKTENKVCLIVIDGWGIAEHTEDNAIKNADDCDSCSLYLVQLPAKQHCPLRCIKYLLSCAVFDLLVFFKRQIFTLLAMICPTKFRILPTPLYIVRSTMCSSE